MNNLTFVCGECGRRLKPVELSQQSLRLAGTGSKSLAVQKLDPCDMLCRACEMDFDADDELRPQASFHVRRNLRESFDTCGTYIDPAKWDAYCLNN